MEISVSRSATVVADARGRRRAIAALIVILPNIFERFADFSALIQVQKASVRKPPHSRASPKTAMHKKL